MTKKQLKIITKEYAGCYTKLINNEIKRLIESEEVEDEIEFERAYELRRVIAKVAFENTISRIWDFPPIVVKDYKRLKKLGGKKRR